jgi:Putative Ig domain
MKKFVHSRHGASKGAALIIVLGFVVLVTALVVAHFSRTTTDRQLAQSSYNDTSAVLLARSALDITVSDLKQEIATNSPVSPTNIQPARYPSGIPNDNPNLVRYSSRNAAASRASTVRSTDASANGRSISLARWNSHYLIPRASTANTIDSTPVASFVPPDWVMVTAQGPNSAPAPNAVIGRYAFAVYDEGGLIDINVGGFPTYASLTRPTRPTRRLAPKYPLEESEIILAAGQPPSFTPDHFNDSIATGASFSKTPNINHNPTSFGANFLPHGLSLNTSTGTISGIPTSPGSFTITLSASNANGTGYGTWNLTVTGFVTPDSTPWPVNRARKGTLAFADLTALPATPTAITPTTLVSSMGNFLITAQIDKLMGWRNYATTQQTGAFDTPLFPLGNADFYARNFLGAAYPLATSFTTVSTAVQNNRTDQAAMNRQELIKLQRTIGFSQSLLQYLGTFSREQNRPAQDWPLKNGNRLSARFDMTNMQIVIPGFRIRPGNNGKGHAWGLQKKTLLPQLFGLVWVDGTFAPGTRLTNPNYYGHWRYTHDINQLPAAPDFFQIINYATNEAIGVNDPNRIQNTFNIGAALIDLYDGDDLDDPDPNPPVNGNYGNTITIIDYGVATYAYGIEAMSYDDPNFNFARPPLAPYPPGPPGGYVLLNRRFENVGEFGYAYNSASTLTSKTLDFASATSHDRAMLDFFTYNEASPRAGIVNLNTRNGPVLASIINGALLNDPGAENTPTALVSQNDALNAGQAIVQETTSATVGRGPALTRADVARLAAAAVAAVPNLAASDETKRTIARALADTGQARTWNLMIDVIAQTGQYAPGTANLTDPSKFVVQGEKRYWLHIALDRDSGSVLGSQLEEVIE